MHELRLALQVDAALQVDVLGSAEEIEELNPLARSRPVDCCPEQLEVVVVEHEVPPLFNSVYIRLNLFTSKFIQICLNLLEFV